jgi:hypothetical protein
MCISWCLLSISLSLNTSTCPLKLSRPYLSPLYLHLFHQILFASVWTWLFFKTPFLPNPSQVKTAFSFLLCRSIGPKICGLCPYFSLPPPNNYLASWITTSKSSKACAISFYPPVTLSSPGFLLPCPQSLKILAPGSLFIQHYSRHYSLWYFKFTSSSNF